MKIDTTKAQIPIWLVWSDGVSGNRMLNAICLDNGIANIYRKALSRQSDIIRAWVEPREANHLYGASMFEMLSVSEFNNMAKSLERQFEIQYGGKLR